MSQVFSPPVLDRCRQLGRAQAGVDEGFIEAVILAHGRGIVGAFLDRWGDELDRRAPGLAVAIEPPWESDVPADALWDPALGAIERLLEAGEGDPVELAARLGLRFAAAGRTADWSAEFSQELTPRWGPWLLPRCGRITVRSDGAAARVVTGAGDLVAASRTPGARGAWLLTGAARRLVGVPGTESIVLLPETSVREQLEIEDEFHSVVGFPEPSEGLADHFAAALSLMLRQAPDYERWVSRVIKAMVPCDCEGSRTRSSSWREAPGVILISSARSVSAVGEMLVHEASHQHLYIAKRLGPIVTGDDRKLYYSPAVARPRPLDRVVLAFHAFANVLLFYEGLRDEGAEDTDGLDATIARLRGDLEVLAEPLVENSDLSAIGRALTEPLLEALGA